MAAHVVRADPLPVKPLRWWSLVAWTVLWTLLAVVVYEDHPRNFINWYSTIVWSISLGIAIVGLLGAAVSGRLIKEEQAKPDPGKLNDRLNVMIITKGDDSLLGALERSAKSLPLFKRRFTNYAGFIVTDEGAEATEAIQSLCHRLGLTLLIVPADFQTPNRTKFKSRAACYAYAELRRRAGNNEYHVYQLDDDTAVGTDTVRSLATFITENRHPGGKKLAQGILVYRREDSPSWLMWLADHIRPGDDMGRFAFTTGRGNPRNGMHGENVLIHSSVLSRIGWDFGPQEIVEDSRFALKFCNLFKGRSAWITARCYGASPANMVDFAKQRIRWAEGMTRLAFFSKDEDITLKDRLLIMHNMVIWGLGVLQPAMTVFMLSWLVSDYNIAPISPWFATFWVLSVAYTCWIYYGGLWANARASGRENPRLIDIVALLPVVFLIASPLEGLSGTIGFCKCLLGYTPLFHVIRKPK